MRGSSNREELARSGFDGCFGHPCVDMYSAPGRSELGGNHTDHQGGHVLACAIDLDILAAVAPNSDGRIRFRSEGFAPIEIELDDLRLREEESGTSAALVRGIASKMLELSPTESLVGFDAYAVSEIPKGAGLSSSAAFEVLVAEILNQTCFDGSFSKLQLAQIGQYAENVYFGKPCGLMDQLACAYGGVVEIDFSDSEHPAVSQIEFDADSFDFSLCMVDTRADHIGLNDEYASITRDMREVAEHFGATRLCDVDESDFMHSIPSLRVSVGDRAVLRAMHYFAEDKRAVSESQALADRDFIRFMELARSSGLSSAMYLQNIYPSGSDRDQSVMLALALAEKALAGKGAVRVHGGGFGGCIQAWVPKADVARFSKEMESVFGTGSVKVLEIVSRGCRKVVGRDEI